MTRPVIQFMLRKGGINDYYYYYYYYYCLLTNYAVPYNLDPQFLI